MTELETEDTLPMEWEGPPSNRQRNRLIMLAALAGAILLGGYAVLYGTEPGTFSYWYNYLCFWVFPLVAGLACLRTAAGLSGRERVTWLFIALGCFCMFVAEAVWMVLELYSDGDVAVTALNTFGYSLAPIFLVIGMLLYSEQSRVVGVSLVQAGNLGIVFSAIVFAYGLILYEVLQSIELGSQVTITTLVEGVFTLSAPAAGLLVSLRLRGQKRAIMGFVLIGLICLSGEYVSFIYFLLNDLVALENPFYVLYLIASASWFVAAVEQGRLEPEARDLQAAARLEERAKQWETLLPALAVAGVMVMAVLFHDSLNEETLPYLSAIGLVFVGSLGVRNWWGQRVETELTADARASEARLRTAISDLRQEVEIRTRAEDELRQSQKMEALGQLTGGVAHDFNNLLGVIQANLELAKLSPGNSEEGPDRLANAMEAVEQGASLTQYLLALSRKQALNPQPIDVVDLLAHTRNGLERTLGKLIKVKINAREDIGTCLADRAQLEGALLNLALNARDAMPHGGEISIEAATAVLDEEHVAAHPDVAVGNYLVIAVRDTGVGISEANLSKVWEPFYTSKKVGEGTGLGLSTVYGFAKQSGGHVEIESEVGVGTEVRLYLPKAGASARPVETASPEVAPLGAGETLLLVEDDDRLRNLLTQILTGLNYRVLNAADGAAALSILDEDPDVRMVLSDVMLIGGISGVELKKQIRQRRPGIEVVLMSGYAAGELAKAGHCSDPADLLTKPFTRPVVAQKIRAVLAGQRLA